MTPPCRPCSPLLLVPYARMCPNLCALTCVYVSVYVTQAYAQQFTPRVGRLVVHHPSHNHTTLGSWKGLTVLKVCVLWLCAQGALESLSVCFCCSLERYMLLLQVCLWLWLLLRSADLHTAK